MHERKPIRLFGPHLVDEYEVRAEEYASFWQFSLRFRGRDSSIPRKVRVDTSGNVVSLDQIGQPLDEEQREAVFKALKSWSAQAL